MKKILSIFSCLGVAASVVSYSPSALALEPSEIYAEAEKFTVQIDGAEPGTGTIIANDNGIYTVLTCRHVMDTEGSYQITTVDGSTHQVTKIENLLDVDLAIVTFSSSNTYPVAELGDSATATNGLDIYVVGYNAPFPGAIEREYLTETAQVQGRREADKNGYQIIHSAIVTSGSSGGGIFDNKARLIGVNGEVFSEANTGKAYGNGVPLEIYLAAKDSPETSSNVIASEDFLSAGNDKKELQDYRRAVDEAIRHNPNYEMAYVDLGVSYFNSKDYQSAIASFDKAIRFDPNNARAYVHRGYIYHLSKNYESAIADYDKAIELQPNYANAYYNRGSSYKNINDSSNALKDFEQAAELYQQQDNTEWSQYALERAAKVYYSRANNYRKLENYQSAIADYDKAIELQPNYANAYYNRGSSYKNMNDSSNVLKNFEQAAELYQQQGNTKWSQYALNQIRQLR